MSIRWKLLFLLLAIALVPVATVTLLANRATARLGEQLGARARHGLTQLTRTQLEQLVSDKAALIGREGNLVNLALQLQAREVEKCLAVESPPERELYLAEDFDGERPPPDLNFSPRHLRVIGRRHFMPVPISLNEPVFKLPPGMLQSSTRQDMLRLAQAVPTYRALQERYGDLLHWHFTSLESGVHCSYPGHGGYPVDYDPRQRRWYARAKMGSDVVWTLPYTDATSRRTVLTAAMAVRGPDGQIAGVTGIDITVSALLERARLPRFGSSTAKVTALEPLDEPWDLSAPREFDLAAYTPEQLGMLVLAEPAEREHEGQWHAPPDRSWLTPDDPAVAALIIRDMYEGRSNVRQLAYQGQPTLWAYSPIWGRRAFLTVIVPQAEVVTEAIRAEESVLSLTRSQSRLTVATLGVVAVVVLGISLAGSRTVTRPVSELVEGARRVAAGDFDARVRVRTRDELGALGQAFNAMVPQLEDRIRMRQSLALAMEVQQNLLPAQPPQFEKLDVAGRSIYCDETGGDYYDFLDLAEAGPRELGVAVGDVTGHGVAAALLMTTARALLRSRAGQKPPLSELMQSVNRLLCQDTPLGRYMTMFYAVVDSERRSIRWANAGHDPAITYDLHRDTFGQLDGGDLPLGIDPQETYSEYRRDNLSPGEIIVLGTDGIWEARNPQGEHFGKDSLRQAIRAAANGSAEQICRSITDALERFRQGHPQDDDITLVVIKVL